MKTASTKSKKPGFCPGPARGRGRKTAPKTRVGTHYHYLPAGTSVTWSVMADGSELGQELARAGASGQFNGL